MDRGGLEAQMKISIDNFDFRQCSLEDLGRILEIQENALATLESEELLRKNTTEMLEECLIAPNITIGAWYDNRLVAFSVLYFPKDKSESLVAELEGISANELSSANYKLCIVDKEFRGNSLQYELACRLLKQASDMGIGIICATASPNNTHSISNIERLGFLYNRTLSKYGYTRNLYYKTLQPFEA